MTRPSAVDQVHVNRWHLIKGLSFRLYRQTPDLLWRSFVVMLLASFSEGLSIALLLPLLAALTPGQTESALLVKLAEFLPFQLKLGPILLAFLCLLIVRQLLIFYREQIQLKLRLISTDLLRIELFNAMLQASWAFRVRQSQVVAAEQLTSAVNRFSMALFHLLKFKTTLLLIIIYSGLALIASPVMVLIFAMTAAGIMFFLKGINRSATKLGVELSQSHRQLYERVLTFINGLKSVKAFGLESVQREQFKQNLNEMRSNQLEFQRKNGIYQFLFGVISAALLCVFIYVGVEVVNLEFSLLAMLLVVATRLLPLISELQSQYQRLLNNLPALAEIQQTLADNIANAEPLVKAPIVLPTQSICLSQVGFSYDATKPVLVETSITLPVGQISALQGVSGGGKTTIADLFAGLLIPDSGHLCLDSQPLSLSQTLAWRDKVTYLAQEPFLFDGTIKDNICWGLNLTDDEIWALLAAVSADFVKDRPAGIYAQVGDRGLLLSGGQRQRIILARALARQSALLILDEATNALDPETELTILNLLKNMKGKMTILIIGHQNDLSHVADNIVIVKKHH